MNGDCFEFLATILSIIVFTYPRLRPPILLPISHLLCNRPRAIPPTVLPIPFLIRPPRFTYLLARPHPSLFPTPPAPPP